MYCALAYLTKLLIISVISWYGMISYPISVTDSLILPILKDSAVFCANFIPKSSSPYIAITSKTAERWTLKSCEIVNCLQKQKLASWWRNCKSLFNDDVVSHLSFSRHQMIADHELIIDHRVHCYPRSLIIIIFITNQYLVIIVCPLLSLPISHHFDHQTWVDGEIQIVF